MILTDRGNRKSKEEKKPYYGKSTLEELVARAEQLNPKPKPGLEFILDMGCECGIILPDDVENDTQQAVWFYENSSNHQNNCLYALVSLL